MLRLFACVVGSLLISYAIHDTQTKSVHSLSDYQMASTTGGASCTHLDIGTFICSPVGTTCTANGNAFTQLTNTGAISRVLRSANPGEDGLNKYMYVQPPVTCYTRADCTGKDASGACTGCGVGDVQSVYNNTVVVDGTSCKG